MFPDKIGEMDFALQAKLLRVLEVGEYINVSSMNFTDYYNSPNSR